MLAMPSLTIRHVTAYRCRQPVAFGEHRMMLLVCAICTIRKSSRIISAQLSSLHFIEATSRSCWDWRALDGSATQISFESIRYSKFAG